MKRENSWLAGTVAKSSLINRNVRVCGHRTSLRLERSMWGALDEIGQREGLTIHEICTMIDARRTESTLTTAIRVFIISYFRVAATDIGHIRAGHGMDASISDQTRPSMMWRIGPA